MARVSNFFMSATLAAASLIAPFMIAPQAFGGDHTSAYLGVMVDKVSPETASALHLSGGTTITTVDQDGPACRAGMKDGDVVSAFNGKPVGGPDQFASMIHSTAP